MIDFVGAGPGAADLITIRGRNRIREADVIIYAGSLVNPELLQYAKSGVQIYNSARMTLEQVMDVMRTANREGKEIVRLHSGDPSLYGAVREQMDILEEEGIPFRLCPGVSACFGAAASLNLEYTLPGISQTLILTRMEGRTAVPEKENIRLLAAHQASMAVYLSAGALEALSEELIEGGYTPETPAAIVYKATWPQERVIRCMVGDLAPAARAEGIDRSAIVLVGEAVAPSAYERSRLYDPEFTTGYRRSVSDHGECESGYQIKKAEKGE